jgi:tRNA nucleotidyltransferase (CCA-adding enzyme)
MPPMSVLERLGSPRIVASFSQYDAVYVVGGAVRDVLLDRTPRQLDFVIEGDAVAVAREVAGRLGGRVVAHERFGTAVVAADGVVFDVASARRERYEHPGALPSVELGASLRDDLARRDFTVNAIAVHLADGEIVEWPGARADLRAGVLRVLHDQSFVDDPTRLLRLARYAARLGFSASEDTEELAVAAVPAVGMVTGSRLGAELRLLLEEPQPAALVELERRGLGAAVLGPGFAVDASVVEAALDLCPADARADLVALAVCCRGFARGDLAVALDRLEFEAGARDTVVEAAGVPGLDDAPDAELWRRLRRVRPEAVVVAGVFGDAAAARRWLEDVRWRRLEITGHDVVAAGLEGPAVGEALDRAMEAMLDGRAVGREAQLEAAVGRTAGL